MSKEPAGAGVVTDNPVFIQAASRDRDRIGPGQPAIG